jgi:uncharacterized membrane protein HdeD (DUF308 family)
VTGPNILFVGIGLVALLGGLATLFTALRQRRANSPRSAAMLIGGMMVTAFGLLLTGFAIAYTVAAPLNSMEPAQ